MQNREREEELTKSVREDQPAIMNGLCFVVCLFYLSPSLHPITWKSTLEKMIVADKEG
jgi:hypothetical protein